MPEADSGTPNERNQKNVQELRNLEQHLAESILQSLQNLLHLQREVTTVAFQSTKTL